MKTSEVDYEEKTRTIFWAIEKDQSENEWIFHIPVLLPSGRIILNNFSYLKKLISF